MPIESRWEVPIPDGSLQKWIFGSASEPLPDWNAFIDPENPDTNILSFSEYRLYSKRVAVGLQEAGLQSGDRVLVFSGNNMFFPSVFLGVLMAGGIFTGANPTFVARELAHQLRDSAATFLLTAEASLHTALEAVSQVGLPKSRVFVFDDAGFEKDLPTSQAKTFVDGIRHWTTLLAPRNKASTFEWGEPRDSATTICCLNYSSGTTGVPKGVEISHRSYIANGVGVVHVSQLQHDWDEYVSQRARGLCFLPLYHAYAQTFFVANFPRLGVPVYIMKGGFDFEKMLRYVEKYRITALSCVPPIVVGLAKHPLARKYDLSSVESVGSGAAPLGHEVAAEVERLFETVHHAGGKAKGRFRGGSLLVRQGWGMTEVTCSCLGWDPNHPAGSTGAVGELAPNYAAKLMDITSSGSDDVATFKEICEPNKTGELWVTGPTLMLGYWRNDAATKASVVTDASGTRWLRTGDLAYVEGQYGPGALFHVIDRVKELIKVKGNQVAPAELEALLLERPDVTDVAVVGVVVNGGEVPRAYVVPNKKLESEEDKRAMAKEITSWMEGRTARFKWLRGGVAFTDAIPKNPSGKILRKFLRERATKEANEITQAKL